MNEKVLPAITLKQRKRDNSYDDEQQQDEASGGSKSRQCYPVRQDTQPEDEEELPSPELDLCVLKPLDFDSAIMDGQQCLALHHRRRFSRQRGSISLDGGYQINGESIDCRFLYS